MDFFQTQLDFLNLISGVALFVVAASFTVIMRLQPDRNYWRWLVGFASFFALRQWGRMMLSGLDDSPNFIVLRTILLATSLLFLLEFARRADETRGKKLPRVIWLVMLVAASSGGLLGLASFNTTMRVSFLILGSIWAAARSRTVRTFYSTWAATSGARPSTCFSGQTIRSRSQA